MMVDWVTFLSRVWAEFLDLPKANPKIPWMLLGDSHLLDDVFHFCLGGPEACLAKGDQFRSPFYPGCEHIHGN